MNHVSVEPLACMCWASAWGMDVNRYSPKQSVPCWRHAHGPGPTFRGVPVETAMQGWETECLGSRALRGLRKQLGQEGPCSWHVCPEQALLFRWAYRPQNLG